jgi:FKBP-type peptidyl-prolyl cis-trans isomerase FkpA
MMTRKLILLVMPVMLMICSCHKDRQSGKIVATPPPSTASTPAPTPIPTPMPTPTPPPPQPSSNNAPTPVTGEPVTTASGLQYWDLVTGTGQTAVSGKVVRVHYTGWLTNGTKFDSSLDRNTPFEFPLGARRVIKGWDEGVEGMKVGGKRQLRIPPELGYGARGAGGRIPPGATLIFDVELLEVK